MRIWRATEGGLLERLDIRGSVLIMTMMINTFYGCKDSVVNNTIFVHAGVDEEAGDWREWGTDDFTFTEKYPAETGKFYMNIVAGHVGTAEISGDPHYHDIYFDGESHYYIDGTVLESGMIPVIQLDTETDKFYRMTETGRKPILSYDAEN